MPGRVKIVLALLLVVGLAGCDNVGADVSVQQGGGVSKAPGAMTTPASASASSNDIQVNKPAIDFTLTDYAGKQVHLLDVAHSHKLTIVNFWASWCPPCRAEMPDLADAYNKYSGKGLEILGVNDQETADQIRQYASDGGFNWPLLLTTNDDLRLAYIANSLPNSFFVDSSGTIVHVARGAMNQSEILDTLAQYGFN